MYRGSGLLTKWCCGEFMDLEKDVAGQVGQESYALHAAAEQKKASALHLPSCYTDPGSVDAWRHARMHRFLLPLIEGDPGATWMTVGDGSFGSDAHFLEQQGLDVLATSLTDASLKIAHDKGFIRKYAAVNAEQIPYRLIYSGMFRPCGRRYCEW